MPKTSTLKNIEKDAAEMYTRTMFYKVHEEIVRSTGDFALVSITEIDSVKTIKIKDPMKKNSIFEVIYIFIQY